MKKFSKYIEEMSMSVTLKPHNKGGIGNNYKVTKVGDKMKQHGGIKPGHIVHDSHIDDLKDSQIKVKYEKPKPNMKKESNDSMQRMADTYMDHEDHKDKKVQSHIKKAKKAYDSGDHEGFYNHTQNAADHAQSLKKNEAIERRMDRKTIIATDPATGRKVVKVAPKKEIDIGKGKNESVEVNEISDTTKVNYINKANKAITDREKLHLKIGAKVDKDKTLEKMRKGVAMAKSKLGEAMDPIGKSGRHDIHHTDTSDYNYHSSHASNVSHGSKGSDEAGEDQYHYKFKDHKIDVNDDHTDTKMSHVQQRVKASGVSPKHHDAVSKSIHKHITMEGVMKMYELKISTMQKYKQAARSDVQDGENARHKGYPEKAIDKRQDKRYKGIDTANKRIDKKQVKMAKGVAFDKRYKGGNMTGASKAIDKIKPGLSDHPKVKSALRRANEEIGE